MKRSVFAFLISTALLYAIEPQSNIMIDLYSQAKEYLQKLNRQHDLIYLKTFLKGGYVAPLNLKNDLKKLKQEKILNTQEYENLLNLINRLKTYQTTPIG